jgi:CubicO group peptidase (beta-lactamase class C family)
MAAFFDDYLTAQMATNHIAGATVSVVKDDMVLFAKGYGEADVAQHIPVTPDKTVFILGSLSKVFTWTAVMQLVEQGKLDLDTDVNTYLDFKIPATYPQPITLNHLMAHTAGFEDEHFDQMAPSAAEMTPLGTWVKSHIPARVRPSGQFSAYANYGTALAGYIIERVSGMSYDDYVDKHLLTPLGMSHTTSRQPLPTSLSADMSQSYAYVNGAYQSQPGFDVVVNAAPAGSFRSTASDMARFMIAHLNSGQYGNGSILQPSTVQLMHSQSFTHDPRLNGMAHGFWELDANDQTIIGHAGSHFICSSMLMLFPDQKLGVFIATNSQGGNAILGPGFTAFDLAFINHFFPKNRPTIAAPADFAQHSAKYSGSYHMTYGRSDNTPEKLAAMVMAVEVQADKDGLVIPMLGNLRFIEVEPLVFRQVDGDTQLVFKQDGSGNITEAFLGSVPLTALIKNQWFETPGFNLILLGLCAILFMSVLITALVSSVVQRRRGNASPPSRLERVVQGTVVLASLLSLLVLISAFASIFNVYGLYVGSLPLWTLVSVLSIVVAVLTLAILVFTVIIWVRRFWGIAGRVHYTLVVLGMIGFVWFMSFWNILGKSF